MSNDKKIECLRYDARAQSLLAEGPSKPEMAPSYGSLTISPIYRAPYTYYEQCIQRFIFHNHHVLELGSGTGLHTYALVQTGAKVTASDISSHSLKVLSKRIGEREGLRTYVADMECLPFENNSFDVVASAGSLSYGMPDVVDAEIRRVLCPGGMFLCVDSLNHNPIYRLNRWVHYLKGDRTKSTVLRIPTMNRIQSISQGFKSAEIHFFGAVSYLLPILACIMGKNYAARVSDAVDRTVNVRRSAFKFVLVANDRL